MEGVAVITGASSGIGRALAIELAREGYRVGLIARRADLLEAVVARIRDEGGSADCVPAAVTGRDEIRQAMGALTERLGPIDLLVANAGIALGTDALVPAAESLEAEFRVNVFGVFYAIEAVVPSMLERGGGHVVAISSLAAHRGLPGAAGYCASKAALTRLVEGLRPDWARAGNPRHYRAPRLRPLGDDRPEPLPNAPADGDRPGGPPHRPRDPPEAEGLRVPVADVSLRPPRGAAPAGPGAREPGPTRQGASRAALSGLRGVMAAGTRGGDPDKERPGQL